MCGVKACYMNKKLLTKKGIALMAIACLGFGIVGCNKSDNNSEEVTQSEVQNEEVEDTYVDDNYEMPEDVDLNKEFEDRVEAEKNNQSNTSSDNSEDNVKEEEQNNDSNANTNDNNQVEVTEKTGVFQGFADDNFVEMKVGNEYSTYRVSSDAKKSLSGKNLGDSVTFEFTKKNGQLFIISAK